MQDTETRIHRALSDPSRVRVLEALRAAPAPLDASQLAQEVGLHPNTVRSHLRVLAEAGLVVARPEERHRRGRPRLVYDATAEARQVGESAGYRLLAEILASHLAGSGRDSAEQAEAAGRSWGRYLVDRNPPHASSSAEQDIATVIGLLDEFGFDPSLEPDTDGHTLLMQHCPFGEVADSYRKIVCSVHLGLMQGALSELGAHVEADRLTPFVRPGVCAAHLEEVAWAGQTNARPGTPWCGPNLSAALNPALTERRGVPATPVENVAILGRMPNISIWEILLLLLVLLLVFGPKRLPQMGRSLGHGMREFKDSITGKSKPEEGDEEEEEPAQPQQPAVVAAAATAEPTPAAAAPVAAPVETPQTPEPTKNASS